MADVTEIKNHNAVEKLTHHSVMWIQSSGTFIIAILFVLLWGITGPIVGFSSGWQAGMSCVSATVTLIMVFALQRAHNKDSRAMQIKLSEIIAALRGANNRLINIEDLSEREIEALHKRYKDLALDIQNSGEESTHPISASEV